MDQGNCCSIPNGNIALHWKNLDEIKSEQLKTENKLNKKKYIYKLKKLPSVQVPNAWKFALKSTKYNFTTSVICST